MVRSVTEFRSNTEIEGGEGERLLAEHQITSVEAKELLPLVLTDEVRNEHIGHWIVVDIETRSFVIAETGVEALSTFRNQYGSGRRAWAQQIIN